MKRIFKNIARNPRSCRMLESSKKSRSRPISRRRIFLPWIPKENSSLRLWVRLLRKKVSLSRKTSPGASGSSSPTARSCALQKRSGLQERRQRTSGDCLVEREDCALSLPIIYERHDTIRHCRKAWKRKYPLADRERKVVWQHGRQHFKKWKIPGFRPVAKEIYSGFSHEKTKGQWRRSPAILCREKPSCYYWYGLIWPCTSEIRQKSELRDLLQQQHALFSQTHLWRLRSFLRFEGLALKHEV